MGVVVGVILGFLSGLGIGGGSLLILYLTLGLGMGQETARGINLLFYLPCAFIAAMLRWREGSVEGRKILPAIIAGCIGAAFFSVVAAKVDTSAVQTGFGWLLILTGLREVFYRPRKPSP